MADLIHVLKGRFVIFLLGGVTGMILTDLWWLDLLRSL